MSEYDGVISEYEEYNQYNGYHEKYWNLFYGTGDPAAYTLYRAALDEKIPDGGTRTDHVGCFTRTGGVLRLKTAFL